MPETCDETEEMTEGMPILKNDIWWLVWIPLYDCIDRYEGQKWTMIIPEYEERKII